MPKNVTKQVSKGKQPEVTSSNSSFHCLSRAGRGPEKEQDEDEGEGEDEDEGEGEEGDEDNDEDEGESDDENEGECEEEHVLPPKRPSAKHRKMIMADNIRRQLVGLSSNSIQIYEPNLFSGYRVEVCIDL